MANVTLEREAAEQLGRLPERIKSRVVGIIERLERWPTVSGVSRYAAHWRDGIASARATTDCGFASKGTK